MTTAPPHPQPRLRLPGVPAALATSAAVGTAAVLVAAVAGGAPQVRGALAGVLLVAAFFALGSVATGVAAAYAPRLSLFVAMLTYTLQVVLLGVVLVAVAGADPGGRSLDAAWLGGTVIAATLFWTGALVVHAVRATPPVEGAGAPSGGEVRG